MKEFEKPYVRGPPISAFAEIIFSPSGEVKWAELTYPNSGTSMPQGVD